MAAAPVIVSVAPGATRVVPSPLKVPPLQVRLVVATRVSGPACVPPLTTTSVAVAAAPLATLSVPPALSVVVPVTA